MMRIGWQARGLRLVGRSCSQSVRQVKFTSTVEADLICAAFDREHAAEMMVPAAKDKFEKGPQQSHKSPDRWRPSRLPLASNHESSERTLARARAIEQSAAP
jgi:hypothetical protein